MEDYVRKLILIINCISMVCLRCCYFVYGAVTTVVILFTPNVSNWICASAHLHRLPEYAGRARKTTKN